MTAADRIDVIVADITTLQVDAIVNAANSSLLGGGGVDGAIHFAAGPELLAACRPLNGCPTGEAKVTPGFLLPARWVIHTVGPVYRDGDSGEADLLAACYRNSLLRAVEHRVRTVAFPAISTGIYGYPPELAAPLAVATVAGFLAGDTSLEQVTFCAFDGHTAALHRAALEAL